MTKQPFLWVALDGLSEDVNMTATIAAELEAVDGNFGFKVNLDYALEHGLGEVTNFTKRPVFADLKIWNGSRTMAEIFVKCHDAGIAVTNAYAFAGGSDTREAGQELRKAISEFRRKRPDSKLQIYAVTILTHYGAQYAQRMFGRSLADIVKMLAEESVHAGADGIIMPGTLLKHVRDIPLKKISPGYRPLWFGDARHSESYSASEIAEGDNVEIVCGSPIMQNRTPALALKLLLAEL